MKVSQGSRLYFHSFCDNLQLSEHHHIITQTILLLWSVGHTDNKHTTTFSSFRREAEDSEWIRILTLLGLSADLYNDLTQENIDKNCPSKLICQALESRDILGQTYHVGKMRILRISS